MSISEIREELKAVPGAHTLIMSYEQGGAVEVYTIGEKSVRVPAASTAAQIREAFHAIEPGTGA